MVNRLLIVKLIYLSILLTGCHGSVADEGEKTEPPQPSYGKAEDGQVLIRHAGDEWSRQKIRDYLTQNTLEFNSGQSTWVPPGDVCPKVRSDLQTLDFEFIKPDIVTDDWEDPRLGPYKQKYEKFKYGMGYYEKLGPEFSMIPTWNITVYDVDTDGDGEVEAILYGERTKRTGMGGPAPGYRIFESGAKWMRGGGLRGDPTHPTWESDDYILSALIKVQDVYTVLVVNDYDAPSLAERQFYAVVYMVGMQNKHEQGSSFNSRLCYFDFIVENKDGGK